MAKSYWDMLVNLWLFDSTKIPYFLSSFQNMISPAYQINSFYLFLNVVAGF